jgi:hypothetical protein
MTMTAPPGLFLSHLENLTMHTLALTGAAMMAVALMTACGDEAGPTDEIPPEFTANSTTADHASTSDPFEDIVVSPCNGETIHFYGTVSGQTNLVNTEGDLLHYETQYEIRAAGIGSTTGATYLLRDQLHQGFATPGVAALDFTVNFREASRFLTSTQGLSFSGVQTFHLTVIPSGDIKVLRASFGDLECKVGA